jgi:tRNA A-37 threonylcarbamoyl transferase component Bud32/tetratricopeptide (TPR) repeat protein
MTPDRWREIEKLFEQVADMRPEERQRILVQADPEIRSEVLSLLACDGETVAGVRAVVRDGAQSVTGGVASPWVGRRLGAWRITGTLGQGGMGTVLEAVRDDAQYRQKAALKLVKREMDSDFARRRFVQERQILAALAHPAIARLLDGGSTEDGLPYLVMEYVEGRDILTYARENHLTIDDRLRLFREVLGGVAFAHQKLVVHRDLKPSNILITAKGEPKLLDFGIARLLDPELLDGAAPETATSAGMMTPDYASPEQTRGEPVTPASDIYSLGAVLYELLTDTRAHRLTTYSAAEIVQAVCTTEPRRPSQAGPERWRRKLAGDIDAIVMTALQKDAARRYASAEAFAEDLGRYLEGHPVRARRDSLLYRARKFVRRNPAAVTAGMAAVAALCAGIVTTTAQARRADRRFQQVRQLANTLLFDIYTQLRRVPGTTAARETLVKTSLEYLNSLAPDAPGDPALEWELASAYNRVGDIQGSPESSNLGRTSEAIRSWEQAARMGEDVARRRHEARVFHLVSVARLSIGSAYRGLLELSRSEEQVQLGLQAAEKMARLQPGNRQNCGALMSGHSMLGDLAMSRGAPEKAMESIERARLHAEACGGEIPVFAISVLMRRGDALHALGRLNEAEEAFRGALRRAEAIGGQSGIAWSNAQLGHVLGAHAPANLGRFAEAAERLRAGLASIRAEMEADPQNLHVRQIFATTASRLADLRLARDPGESERLAARALELLEGPLAENRGDTEWEEKGAMAASAMARARARLGRADAEDRMRLAVSAWQGLTARNPRDMNWQMGLGLARLDRAICWRSGTGSARRRSTGRRRRSCSGRRSRRRRTPGSSGRGRWRHRGCEPGGVLESIRSSVQVSLPV